MCHDIPLKNPRGFAAQIIRRHHTRYLPIPFEDLVSDLVSEFWLAEQVRKPGTEEEKISFFWKVGRNRIYKLSRFYAGLPEENISALNRVHSRLSQPAARPTGRSKVDALQRSRTQPN